MKIKLLQSLLTLLLVLYASVLSAELVEVPEEYDDRYRHLLTELRCLVCQNQNLADSNSELAMDLRLEVKDMLIAGASNDEIFQFMSDRYGDFVLYKPRLAAKTYLLWFGPFLLLAAGAFIVWRIVTKTNVEKHPQQLSAEEKHQLDQWNQDHND